MVFDSAAFLVFFGLFLAAYYAVAASLHAQNVLLLVGSYVFYGWWDWRFLGLMTLSSGVDYLAGLALGSAMTSQSRRAILAASLSTNLAILFTFKYFDFFASSLQTLLGAAGLRVPIPLLHVVLPVGISFYTFQSMSYTIDVFKRQLAPERNPIRFFAFVSFFPHLVAGPIMRAGVLLRQIARPRRIDSSLVREAVWLLAWGFFLKEVVADGAAQFVDLAFTEHQGSGWTTLIGTLAFSIQIYCDFNAYG